MPANKYALIRYKIIDECIRRKFQPFPSKEDLRQACEEHLHGAGAGKISLSTIDKDLWAMRNESKLGFNAPIAFSKQHKGYFYENSNYTLDGIALNQDEVEAIRFAANILFQFKNLEIFNQFEFAIEKIFARAIVLPETEKLKEEKFIQFEKTTQVTGNEWISSVLQAVRNKLWIEFQYEKFTGEPIKSHRIQPLLIKEYRHRWYVIGKFNDKSGLSTFGLERIKTLKVLNEKFKPDKSFNPEAIYKNSIGIIAYEGSPSKVILSFTPFQGKYIKTQPLHQSQKIIMDNDKELRVSIDVLLTFELKVILLGFGDQVKIIAPKKLANEMKDQLKSALNNYV